MKPNTNCKRCGEPTTKSVKMEYEATDGEVITIYVEMCNTCK